jgi:hypothetical protein
MEAVSWSEISYKQAVLPKLRITEEISRRDSITSSKTADSGYNSDPDISLSPLDFVRPDKRRLLCSIIRCMLDSPRMRRVALSRATSQSASATVCDSGETH